MTKEKSNLANILIGKELKIARLQKGITQEQIGEYIGVTRQTVSYWESGNRAMNLDDFLRICDHFGFDAYGMINSVMRLI